MRKVLRGAAVTAIGWALMAPAAMAAQGDGEKIGSNLGHLLGSWSRSLYLGIAGLIALVFLLNRRFADLAIFIVAAVVVGGFVLDPSGVAGAVRGIWNSLTA